MKNNKNKYDVCVIGGAGHVGAPLSIVMAKIGMRVLVYDLNKSTMDQLQQGNMPFFEEGAEPLLKEVLSQGRLGFTSDVSELANIQIRILELNLCTGRKNNSTK